MTSLETVLAGAVAMGFVVAGLYFLRFWTRTRDGLFLYFAIAFWLFAVNQALTAIHAGESESNITFYSLRLVGFLLIIGAILRKNFAAK